MVSLFVLSLPAPSISHLRFLKGEINKELFSTNLTNFLICFSLFSPYVLHLAFSLGVISKYQVGAPSFSSPLR